jgi:ribosomal protein S18 acetylase RimI-like enzyme
VPADVELGALGLEHAELVAAAWPHDDFEQPSGKLAYIRACIAAGPTVAARQRGRLVSFVLTHTDGSMGVLHTDPAERGRGLGRLVLSALVRTLLARGAPIFGFVAVGNAPSTSLVTSLGLRPVQRGAWLTVRSSAPQSDRAG